MKKISIYQLPIEHNAKFMGINFCEKHNVMPSLSDYKKVWEGEIEDSADLEDIYTKFNIAHPADYHAHSLSTSDVVEMDGKFYYCDSCGWKELDWEEKKMYIVTAYGSATYYKAYAVREKARAKAESLNADYYQHKVWNVEEIIVEE